MINTITFVPPVELRIPYCQLPRHVFHMFLYSPRVFEALMGSAVLEGMEKASTKSTIDVEG